jgi:hypothetical protein
MMFGVSKEQPCMSNVVPICAAKAVAPHADARQSVLPQALIGALRRYWRRARLGIEAWGWLCAVASFYALVIS